MKYLGILALALAVSCGNSKPDKNVNTPVIKDSAKKENVYVFDTVPGDPNLKIDRDTTTISYLLNHIIILNKFSDVYPTEVFTKGSISNDFINGLKGKNKAGKKGRFTYKFYINSSDGKAYCDLLDDGTLKRSLKLFGYVDGIYMFETERPYILYCDTKKDLIFLVASDVNNYYPEMMKYSTSIDILNSDLTPKVYLISNHDSENSLFGEIYIYDNSRLSIEGAILKHSTKISYLEGKKYYSVDYTTLLKIQEDAQMNNLPKLDTTEVKEDYIFKRW